jgi:leucyl aminopeptidase
MLDKSVVFIECGITFDSGGLCVKTPHEMEYWHGDRVGAAGVVATIQLMVHLHLLFWM